MAAATPRVRKKPKINWTPYLFLIVPLLVYLVWIIGPMLYTFYLSLTSWDGISPELKFIGIKNFDTLFDSLKKALPSAFEYSLINNLKWLVAFITVPTVIGLGLAILLNQGIKGDRFFKVGIYLPQVLSFVVIALIWSWIYNPRYGLINSFLFRYRSRRPARLAGRQIAGYLVDHRCGGLAPGWLRDDPLPCRAQKYRPLFDRRQQGGWRQ